MPTLDPDSKEAWFQALTLAGGLFERLDVERALIQLVKEVIENFSIENCRPAVMRL